MSVSVCLGPWTPSPLPLLLVLVVVRRRRDMFVCRPVQRVRAVRMPLAYIRRVVAYSRRRRRRRRVWPCAPDTCGGGGGGICQLADTAAGAARAPRWWWPGAGERAPPRTGRRRRAHVSPRYVRAAPVARSVSVRVSRRGVRTTVHGGRSFVRSFLSAIYLLLILNNTARVRARVYVRFKLLVRNEKKKLSVSRRYRRGPDVTGYTSLRSVEDRNQDGKIGQRRTYRRVRLSIISVDRHRPLLSFALP